MKEINLKNTHGVWLQLYGTGWDGKMDSLPEHPESYRTYKSNVNPSADRILGN